MRQSKLFTKARREAPADEVAKNAQLLIRAGYIHKEMAGVYDYLPLGLRVVEKIKGIIREEMNAIGGQEFLMTTLQDPRAWEKSGRWNDAVIDNWFKTKLAAGGELGIANTHEEPITELLTHHLTSYKDLPLAVYQFQTKFRNELRAKSGIIRAREFLMKDMYSFSRTEKEFRDFYETCAAAYLRIFDRMGIGHLTYRTIAAGGSFTAGLTDEFQTVSDAGEDTIYLDGKKGLAINKEILTDENLATCGLEKTNLQEVTSIEVGNIFPLGTTYSEAIGLKVKDEQGNDIPVVMGSYGIGLGRLFGTIAEVLADDKGLVWPEQVSPFRYHLLFLGHDDDSVKTADELYDDITARGIEVLYDDRTLSAGQKFAESDLLGIAKRIVVGREAVSTDVFEVVDRATGTVVKTPRSTLLD